MSPDATKPSASIAVGVDVGGTFTDATLVYGGHIHTVKVPTTREDHGVGVMEAVSEVLRAAEVPARSVARIAHGMTVGTNALLEGHLARTALVATRGFGDVLELRRQDRADLYRLSAAHPAPIVPHERVVEVLERCGPDGPLIPLEPTEARRVADAVRALGVEAVAVCLLFAFRHPAHERALARALAEALPGVHVSVSSEVLAEIREYERAATTAVDAALTPLLGTYLERLSERTGAAGLPAPQVMQSNGGVIDVSTARRHASRTVLSGPAAGVIGASLWARTEQIAHALAFDMGGTSCDVSLIAHGEPGRTAGTEINGHPLHLPMLDIQTVSAGGGSIAWADTGGALRVGPESAGARPGPAAYGLGGSAATVTDAQVVLGRVDTVGTPGRQTPLSADKASAAVDALARQLGLTRARCAEGIVRVANHEMARALRVVSVERGVHPADTTLIAFGGAGPLHACEVADLLGIERVIAPACAGVLAALGTLIAGERRDWVQTVLLPLSDATGLGVALAPLLGRAAATLPGAEVDVSADCRFVGQAHALTVPWPGHADAAVLRAQFLAAHTARYGDADAGAPIEIVSLRVAAVRPGEVPEIDTTPTGPALPGPCGIAMAGATLWVPTGWTTRSCADASHDIRRDDGATTWIR
jgi:N-methylhydantoinase A/oxoprolinase/acetone carboxylase beta subunit